MAFDAAAARALFAAVQSHAKSLGLFAGDVPTHAPVSPPTGDPSCWIELGPVVPVQSSGLAAVSIEVTLRVFVTSSMMQRPLDSVDPAVLGAVSVLLGEYAGNFTLGGLIREVDVFGGLRAEPGFVQFEGKPLRVVEITLPLIVNDAWTEAA